jgi:hypothetical protein
LYVDSNNSEKQAATIFTVKVRRFSCHGSYRQIAKKVAITSMKVEEEKECHLNCDNQETKSSIPGPQYMSETVYTGQISLSIDNRVNEFHCHACLNQLKQSVVVVSHCIPLNSNG